MVASSVAAGTGVGHLIQQLQYSAAVDVPGKVCHVRGHQRCHRELLVREIHWLYLGSLTASLEGHFANPKLVRKFF